MGHINFLIISFNVPSKVLLGPTLGFRSFPIWMDLEILEYFFKKNNSTVENIIMNYYLLTAQHFLTFSREFWKVISSTYQQHSLHRAGNFWLLCLTSSNFNCFHGKKLHHNYTFFCVLYFWHNNITLYPLLLLYPICYIISTTTSTST